MEISDYNAKLAEARTRYRDSASEMKENHASEKRALEKLHKKRQDKAVKSFINAKEGLEAQNKANHDRYIENTQKEIQKRTDRFVKDLGATKNEFARSQKENKSKYDTKLKNISSGFSTQMKERDRLGKLRSESAEKHFKEAAFQNQRTFDKNLSDIQQSNTEKFNTFRDNTLLERQDQDRKHLTEKKLLTQDASVRQNLMKNSFQKEKQRLRDSAAVAQQSQKNHTENQLENLRNNNTAEKDKMKANFEYIAQNITDKGTAEVKKLQDENRRDLARREAQFANSRLSLEQKINKAVNTGESNQTDLMLRKNKEAYENRLKNYDHRLNKMNLSHQGDKSRGIEKQQEARNNMKIKHRRELDKQENVTRNVRQYEMGHLKKKHQEQLEAVMQSKDMVDLQGKEKVNSDRLSADMKLKNQREDLIRQMNKANEKQQDEIREMAKSFSEEQSKFIASEKRTSNQDKADIRNKMTLDRAVAAASFEDRIHQLEQENKRLVENYEGKLSVQMNKAAREIQRREIAEQERNKEIQRATARTLQQKDRQAYLDLVKLKGDFEKRLEEQQNSQEIQLTTLMRKYEDRIEQNNLEAKKKHELAINMERNNFQKLKEAKEIEMRAMENQFKLKIDKLKNTNRKMQVVQSMRNDALEARKAQSKES
ncbi:MAG: hypothetical protein CME70_03755 [Halobacteriovorax sp.]|nr:hypothetical protein [Halobacteriovorax sp.]|tara:strand:+ start:176333 stop:178297 length:1965 start_codon:yes stop_codon:yes gene_type:complete